MSVQGCGPDPAARSTKPPWAQEATDENAQPGSRGWKISKPATSHEVEGYALRTTVAPGDTLEVAASVNVPSATVSWSSYRLGFYGGTGGRLISLGGETVLGRQPPCRPRDEDGLVACGWSRSLRYHVPDDAPGGAYVLKLSRQDGYESYVPFVVRNVRERSDVLVVLATSTWAAYNNFGGTSLYEDDDDPKNPAHRAFRVSYDRPYAQQAGSGTLLTNEGAAITWLESQHLRISYAAAEDFEGPVDILEDTRVLVLPGHDEYWTETRRERTQAAVARGMSLLNLSANTGFWRVRLEPAADGRERRTVTCFKNGAPDPGRPYTHQFRQDPENEPEDALFGVMYRDRLEMVDVASPVLLGDTSHWVFAETGLEPGDVLWRANGYEVDSIGPGVPPDTAVLASSPLLSLIAGVGWSNMVIRETPSGAFVFASGGLDFARTLSTRDMADPKAQRIVANVLYRGLGRPVPELHAFPGWREAKSSAVIDQVRAAGVFAGVPGQPGTDDGPPGSGRLWAPLGIAAGADGALLVTDGTSGAVRRLEPDGTLETVSGFPTCAAPIAVVADKKGRIWVVDGDNGVIYERAVDETVRMIGLKDHANIMTDGPGNTARFAYPAGLALSPDERTLWVADRGGDALRTVDLTSTARTVHTVAQGQVGRPTFLASAKDGGLYVQDIYGRVYLWKAGKATVAAGSGTMGYADGPAAQARFVGHGGLALLPSGALLISDPGNYRIRKLEAGHVTTFAGNGRGADRDGEPSALILPAGVAVGADGRVYVAEAGNAAIRVLVP